MWIAYQYNEELETLLNRIFRLHDSNIGKVLLENHEEWLKPVKKHPIFVVDCSYESSEFHNLFPGLVLRDIRRVNRHMEKQRKYIAVALFPLEQQKIEDLLFDSFCVGIWMLSQKAEWIPSRFFQRFS